MKLAREIRVFGIDATERLNALNTWAGVPGIPGRQPFWVLRGVVRGAVDPRTGFLCDIKEVDRWLRERVVPRLASEANRGAERTLQRAFGEACGETGARWEASALAWWLSPYLWLDVHAESTEMVSVTQSFEFSAAHRLAGPGFSDAENLRVFGKCSNPNGHGHNYVLEVTVRGVPDARTGTVVDLLELQRAVRERVVEPFDHRNLNLECAEFAALNPSVEHIAVVIWRRLEGHLGRARLSRIRVWETPKTYAEYEGEPLAGDHVPFVDEG